METFYHVARTTLVKDVKYYDAFDLSFAECFEGVVSDDEFKEKLKSWLETAKENELSEERKAQAPGLPSEELLKELQKRMDEQKERHDGGAQVDRHRGHLSLSAIPATTLAAFASAVIPERARPWPSRERGNLRPIETMKSLMFETSRWRLRSLECLKRPAEKNSTLTASIKKTCDNMGEIEIVETSQTEKRPQARTVNGRRGEHDPPFKKGGKALFRRSSDQPFQKLRFLLFS